MCGIAGSLGRDPLDEKRISRTIHVMQRRGPDARGVCHDEIGGQQVNLLHTRLSIIDLNSRADQPFSRGGVVLVFNGEIYNYVEVAEELRRCGTRLTTGSDTEVLLESYRTWGEDFLDRLEGMWAFALLDRTAGKLLLSRDRFGEKPLFIMERAGTIYFASEPKALAALTGAQLSVNARHIRRYLSNGFRSLFKTEDTFFENVFEIKPATTVTIHTNGKSFARRYWTQKSEPQLDLSPQEAVEGVRQRLRRSIELRMRADVPLAFCLSGGIDSTALVSLAAKEIGVDVHAFSVIDGDERYNEAENISETVDFLGCKHFVTRTSTDQFFERMQDLVSYHDAPVPTISYYMHAFLSQEISRQGYKVSISGTAADELFTGYYDHYSFWLAEQVDRPDFDAKLEDWRNSYGRWINNPLLQDPLTFHHNPQFRGHLFQNEELFNGFLVDPLNEAFYEHRFLDNLLRNRMRNELHHEVVPVILRADDVNSMRYSIENRSPYLDRELVEFAGVIPNHCLIRDGLPKWPLRQAVEGLVPDNVRLDKRKRGFNASIESLIDRKDESTRERLLSPGPIFDLVRREAVEDFLSNDMTDNSFSKFLFSFVSAKLFLEAQSGHSNAFSTAAQSGYETAQ